MSFVGWKVNYVMIGRQHLVRSQRSTVTEKLKYDTVP